MRGSLSSEISPLIFCDSVNLIWRPKINLAFNEMMPATKRVRLKALNIADLCQERRKR